MSILEYSFFQNALIGSLLASIVCGIIGTYIVSRRLVFISGGITHASFGGIGLGVFFGINPIFSAMVYAVLSAFGVQWISLHVKVREDSAIALFWTFGMSIGILCSFLTPGFMPDLPSFLFGSILTVGTPDLVLLTVVTTVVAAVFTLLYSTIVSIAFDPTFARSQRLPVDTVEYVMMGLIAVTIVSTLRLVGIVLAISLLTVPQMTDCTARFLADAACIVSFVVMTGFTMNLTPSRNVMNTEKFPIAVDGTSFETKLPTTVKTSTVAIIISPLRMSRFLFLPYV